MIRYEWGERLLHDTVLGRLLIIQQTCFNLQISCSLYTIWKQIYCQDGRRLISEESKRERERKCIPGNYPFFQTSSKWFWENMGWIKEGPEVAERACCCSDHIFKGKNPPSPTWCPPWLSNYNLRNLLPTWNGTKPYLVGYIISADPIEFTLFN